MRWITLSSQDLFNLISITDMVREKVAVPPAAIDQLSRNAMVVLNKYVSQTCQKTVADLDSWRLDVDK